MQQAFVTRLSRGLIFAAGLAFASVASATPYEIDTKGAHAFIQFKISHLGFSWLYGRFDEFSGSFNYDEANPAASSVDVKISTASVNSNHAERDKHLRAEDFLYVDKFPEARFVSKKVEVTGPGQAKVTGELSLRGVTREVVLDMHEVGKGDDPWGNYRAGFAGTTTFRLADFGIPKNLGSAAESVEMILSIEGVRQ